VAEEIPEGNALGGGEYVPVARGLQAVLDRAVKGRGAQPSAIDQDLHTEALLKRVVFRVDGGGDPLGLAAVDDDGIFRRWSCGPPARGSEGDKEREESEGRTHDRARLQASR